MIDRALRRRAEIALAPLVRATPHRVHPTVITVVAVVPGVGAAVAAGAGLPALAVALWLTNRLLDGIDGALARRTRRQTDLGAYADILLDVVVYAAVPLGVAVGLDARAGWIAAAVLLATFYVNAISWSFLSALLERRGAGAAARGDATSVTMPPGLVEGGETIVLFTVMLAIPGWSIAVMWGMAGAVLIGVGQRVVAARRSLGPA